MKIINIALTSQNGGLEQSCLDYCIILKQMGHEVLAILKNNAPYIKQFIDAKIPVKIINNRFGYFDIFAIKQIKTIINQFEPNVIISNGGRSQYLVKNSLKTMRLPQIISFASNFVVILFFSSLWMSISTLVAKKENA